MTEVNTAILSRPKPQLKRRKNTLRMSTGQLAFAFAFIFSLICNFTPQLGPISAAAVFGLGFMSLLLLPSLMWSNPMSKWAIAIPLLSLLSAIWSVHPGNTVYYSIQLILTVLVAIAMAAFPNQQPVLKGLFLATLAYAIISLIFGKYVLWEKQEYIFAGLLGSKNAYGAMNFYAVLLGVYAIHYGLVSRRWVYSGLGVCSVLLGFVGILLARASGALVTAFIGIALYLILINLGRLRKNVRIVLLALLTVITVLAGLVLSTIWDQLYTGTLAYFGKDADLTGRTFLWDVADKIIDRNYWLGVGHFGFWVQNDPLPEAIWAEMGINSRGGFNFHNSLRELMVHFGILGTVLYLGIILALLARLMRSVVLEPRMDNVIFAVIVLSIFTKFTFETVLPLGPVSPDAVFIITALSLRRQTGRQNTETAAPMLASPVSS